MIFDFNMKKLPFSSLKKREKILLVIVSIVCTVLLINKLIIGPTFRSLAEVTEKYESKRLLLSRYDNLVSNENWYKDKLNTLEDEFNVLEGKILSLDTEELASAKLQELAKNIARRNGLSVSKSIASKKKIISEDPYLVFISANFEINDISKMEKLKAFLYDLEYNKEKLFFVNDLKIKGIGLDDVRGISVITSLAIIASIKKR
ncbi:MAG: hypothetical protein ACUZ8O_01270 [Candidatus Anammoxibacter sp.]